MKKNLLMPLLAVCFNAYAQAPYVIERVDIALGTNPVPTNLCSSGGKIYFGASVNGNSNLYVTDGTATGTSLVKEINPGGSATPLFITALNGKVVFYTNTAATGSEPWVSDGTSAGTFMLKDIFPGTNGSLGSTAPMFVQVGNKLFFSAKDALNGQELWVTDGTSAGTNLVKDIAASGGSSNPRSMAAYNGKLLFNNIYDEIWQSDGTAAGTNAIKSVAQKGDFTSYKGKLYFAGNDLANGYELWCTDGTASGTYMVKDINPGYDDGLNRELKGVVFKNELYFVANDGTNGTELWKSDGTASGTVMLKDIYPGSASGVEDNYFAVADSKLIFRGSDDGDIELWGTDGTAAGTALIKDLWPGFSSLPAKFFSYNKHVLFTALESNSVTRLYATDGTAAGTIMIKPPSVTQPATTTGPIDDCIIHTDGLLYLPAKFAANDAQLWRMIDTAYLTIASTAASVGEVKIYPNPNSGTFTLQSDDANFTTGVLQVYDAVGRKVYEQQVNSKKETIRMQQPAGIYTVKLQMGDAVLTKQVVIE